MVVSVRLACVEGPTERRHPLIFTVGSGTDVGALSSNRYGLVTG